MNKNITNAFVREIEAFLDCLEDTIRVIRDEDWVTGARPRNRPVHQACHALVSIVKYVGVPSHLDGISFRFKVPASYPTRDDILARIDAIRPAILPYVEKVVQRSLADREFHVPPLYKLTYLIRHSIIHLSYMRDELIERGYRVPEYSKRYRPGSA